VCIAWSDDDLPRPLIGNCLHVLLRLKPFACPAHTHTHTTYTCMLASSPVGADPQYLRGLYVAGQTAEALRVPALMTEAGVAPTVYTYTLLLQVRWIGCPRHSSTIKHLVLLCSSTCLSLPTPAQHYLKCRDFARVTALYRNMLQERIEPNLHTLTLLLKACALTGRMSQASHVLAHMARLGLRPNVFVFNTLLSGFLRQGANDAASQVRGGREPHPLARLQPHSLDDISPLCRVLSCRCSTQCRSGACSATV
jgi:pentatricopeptide repeat protein